VVVLPTAVGLLEQIGCETLDRIGDADGGATGLWLVPDRLGDFNFTDGHGDERIAGFDLDILDLAGIAIAVEGDDDEREADGCESIEQYSLILRLQFGMQPI